VTDIAFLFNGDADDGDVEENGESGDLEIVDILYDSAAEWCTIMASESRQPLLLSEARESACDTGEIVGEA